MIGAVGRRGPLVVLVTGASSGIGRACALASADAGHAVVLVARSASDLDDVAEECLRRGAGAATVLTADVGEDAEVREVVRQTLLRHDRLDAVLHCAGVVAYGRTEDVDADDFAAVVRTNLLGSAAVARHVVPVLRRQEQGDLVVVGSLLGHVNVPEMTPYVVSKWAVRALVRQLRIENLDRPGVRVSHVAPGSVDTPIYDNALDQAGGVNTPPPPTISPERAAAVVLSAVGSRRPERQTAWSNYALIAAFRLAPRVWDRVVGPAFDLVSRRTGAAEQG